MKTITNLINEQSAVLANVYSSQKRDNLSCSVTHHVYRDTLSEAYVNKHFIVSKYKVFNARLNYFKPLYDKVLILILKNIFKALY